MRVLVVVQRYGAEVIGGSESHARAMVRRLAMRHSVEVATTTALDYWTWAPHYAAGEDSLDGVRVRFHNEHIPDVVLGTGLDVPPDADGAAFRARHGLRGRVAVYLGQVSEAKGVDELLAAWDEVDATLVLCGEVRMPLPAR